MVFFSITKFHQILDVGQWFPLGTPVSSTTKLISFSALHRLHMTLAIPEVLDPSIPKPFLFEALTISQREHGISCPHDVKPLTHSLTVLAVDKEREIRMTVEVIEEDWTRVTILNASNGTMYHTSENIVLFGLGLQSALQLSLGILNTLFFPMVFFFSRHKVSSDTWRRSVVSSGYSGFLHQKTEHLWHLWKLFTTWSCPLSNQECRLLVN